MTLIVGVKCNDGVVVGADGAATYGALGQRTILQPTKKLSLIGDRFIVGVSGPIGLGQRIVGVIEHLATSEEQTDKQVFESQDDSVPRKPVEAMRSVRQGLMPHIDEELRVAANAAPAIGQTLANQSAISHTLLAALVQRTPCLFHFDHQGAPEEVPDQLPFISIGSGQQIADPFLAFIRRIFWGTNSLPNLGDGTFAVLWTLLHAIQTNAGGVAEPVQIATLTRLGTKELSAAELVEHRENIQSAEDALKNYRNSLTSQEPLPASSLPSPPSL